MTKINVCTEMLVSMLSFLAFDRILLIFPCIIAWKIILLIMRMEYVTLRWVSTHGLFSKYLT